MKRIVLVMAFAFLGIFTAQAQWWIGGSVSANLNKETKSFSLGPDVGYCFSDLPFSIGCTLEYGGTAQTGEPYSHSLSVTPYFRYNVYDINERYTLFVDLYSDIDAIEFSSFDIGLSPGIAFDITEHWSAEFSLGFLEYGWERTANEKPKHSFGLNLDAVATSFGINYSF